MIETNQAIELARNYLASNYARALEFTYIEDPSALPIYTGGTQLEDFLFFAYLSNSDRVGADCYIGVSKKTGSVQLF